MPKTPSYRQRTGYDQALVAFASQLTPAQPTTSSRGRGERTGVSRRGGG